jgi:hypothetical protein
MAESGPSTSTIKRLFALSGNRCAFPRCDASMALDDTLVGEICHIKGRKPDAARYDPAQMPAERNDYDNLILLCAPHHKVVDDDEDSYTVERLRKMKVDHETGATPVPDKEATQVAAAYSMVTTVGQSGGIAANNFTANNVTFNTAQSESPVSKRQLEALENLWGIICTLRKEFCLVVFVDTVLLAKEMDEYFKEGRHARAMDVVRYYANRQYAAQKFMAINPDKERPFVSHRIWSLFFVVRQIYGRAVYLVETSYRDRKYNDWRLDSGFDQILRSMLPGAIFDNLKQKQMGGLSAAIDQLEAQFLAEAGMNKR